VTILFGLAQPNQHEPALPSAGYLFSLPGVFANRCAQARRALKPKGLCHFVTFRACRKSALLPEAVEAATTYGVRTMPSHTWSKKVEK
jgi:hypothetical protein